MGHAPVLFLFNFKYLTHYEKEGIFRRWVSNTVTTGTELNGFLKGTPKVYREDARGDCSFDYGKTPKSRAGNSRKRACQKKVRTSFGVSGYTVPRARKFLQPHDRLPKRQQHGRRIENVIVSPHMPRLSNSDIEEQIKERSTNSDVSTSPLIQGSDQVYRRYPSSLAEPPPETCLPLLFGWMALYIRYVESSSTQQDRYIAGRPVCAQERYKRQWC